VIVCYAPSAMRHASANTRAVGRMLRTCISTGSSSTRSTRGCIGDAGPLSQRARAGSERLHLGRSDAACVYLGKDTTETFVTQGLAVGSLIALAWAVSDL
jgi:hypothetical protein